MSSSEYLSFFFEVCTWRIAWKNRTFSRSCDLLHSQLEFNYLRWLNSRMKFCVWNVLDNVPTHSTSQNHPESTTSINKRIYFSSDEEFLPSICDCNFKETNMNFWYVAFRCRIWRFFELDFFESKIPLSQWLKSKTRRRRIIKTKGQNFKFNIWLKPIKMCGSAYRDHW